MLNAGTVESHIRVKPAGVELVRADPDIHYNSLLLLHRHTCCY